MYLKLKKIVYFLESLAGSLKSIGTTHETLLKVNKLIVAYLLKEKEKKKEANKPNLDISNPES